MLFGESECSFNRETKQFIAVSRNGQRHQERWLLLRFSFRNYVFNCRKQYFKRDKCHNNRVVVLEHELLGLYVVGLLRFQRIHIWYRYISHYYNLYKLCERMKNGKCKRSFEKSLSRHKKYGFDFENISKSAKAIPNSWFCFQVSRSVQEEK